MGINETDVFQLRMDTFTPSDRRMDAFPSVRYEVPPTYQSDALVIKYPVDCEVTATIESHTVYLERGDLLFIAPYARHRTHQMVPGGLQANVSIRPSRVWEVLPRIGMTVNPIRSFLEQCTQPSGPLFLHLPAHGLDFDRDFFTDAAGFFIRHTSPSEAELLLWENRLERLLLKLLRLPEIQALEPERTRADADSLSRILGYIQRNLETATLKDAAADLGWNASHLSRYIRNRTGRSFTEIVQVLRLDEASTLLIHTDISVDEAMVRTGYSGKANFYAIFRQRFGMTPARYRQSHREGKARQAAFDTDQPQTGEILP